MRRSGLHRGGRALSNGCVERSRQARGSPGDHARSPFLVRIHPGAAYPRDRAVPLRETLTSSSPLAGILTFLKAPETTQRGTAQQQRVRSHALERREPSTILPNHPPHIAHIASAPNARADCWCSRAHAQAARIQLACRLVKLVMQPLVAAAREWYQTNRATAMSSRWKNGESLASRT